MLTKLFKKRSNLISQHDTHPNQSNLNEFIRIFNYSSNVKYEAVKNPDGEIIVGFKLVNNNNKKNTNNKIPLPTDIIDNPLQIDRGPNPYLDNSIDPLDKFKQELDLYLSGINILDFIKNINIKYVAIKVPFNFNFKLLYKIFYNVAIYRMSGMFLVLIMK